MSIRERIRQVKHLQNKYFICVLENPTDIVNIASTLRNISAFGVTKLYVIGGDEKLIKNFETSRKSERLRKVSVGANKWVFTRHFSTTADCICHLNKNLYTSVVTSSHQKAKKNVILYEEIFTQKRLAVWFGNETRGISDEAIRNADLCIQIPMGGIVESLNLGVSTGVVLSYIGYQRLKFVYEHNKVSFRPKGLGKIKMKTWSNFIRQKETLYEN